jgi:HTH-type transcriptional regulator / antitoxin HipB
MHDRASSIGAIAASVRARREALGLRQQEVADLAGVSTRFVHTLETGKPSVQLDRVLAVMHVLGLELRSVPRDPSRTSET